ncbi:unnamed protein product [Rotaria sp. Silwood1]|nr:unnamed protein product [Rotaria sp. Silwood1]CAF1298181.1 unnamed protein product [Rotaria sp. Silwood1]CAF1301902.1 unnamed protein product [Rotaria sp. Silwood1]CAF3517955.1 unnamed protein product [Rotaria sp. Silwood1]CAF3575059.1 unnamed protein product [Rotaria sp. Silwood1]
MSRLSSRRNLSLKELSTFNEPPGSNLMFQWSISAADSPCLADNSSVILPSINTTRSQRKVSTDSSLTHVSSTSYSSMSTRKSSYLPFVNKKYHSSISPEHDQSSTQNSPLLLNYSQLHPVLCSSPTKQPIENSLFIPSISDNKRNSVSIHSIFGDKQNSVPVNPISDTKRNSVFLHSISSNKRSSVSIRSISDKKRNSISSVNSKVSSTSKTTTSSKTKAPLSSTKPEQRLLNNNLVRLNTAQLRRLNVSEKYMDEAKKLYFNIPCRSFIPRVVMV